MEKRADIQEPVQSKAGQALKGDEKCRGKDSQSHSVPRGTKHEETKAGRGCHLVRAEDQPGMY